MFIKMYYIKADIIYIIIFGYCYPCSSGSKTRKLTLHTVFYGEPFELWSLIYIFLLLFYYFDTHWLICLFYYFDTHMLEFEGFTLSYIRAVVLIVLVVVATKGVAFPILLNGLNS